MDAVGVRGRPPIKCKDRVLEYFKEMRDGEGWRVDGVGVRGKLPMIC